MGSCGKRIVYGMKYFFSNFLERQRMIFSVLVFWIKVQVFYGYIRVRIFGSIVVFLIMSYIFIEIFMNRKDIDIRVFIKVIIIFQIIFSIYFFLLEKNFYYRFFQSFMKRMFKVNVKKRLKSQFIGDLFLFKLKKVNF